MKGVLTAGRGVSNRLEDHVGVNVLRREKNWTWTEHTMSIAAPRM